MSCASCAEWNADQAPFRLFGNTYFVGTAGLSAVLVTSDAGHVLLDGGLTQSAPLIARHIAALGFRLQDVRLILTSHAHFDHVGGVAALQRASGAAVAASEPSARALARGEPTPDDPQYAFGRDANEFPAVAGARVVSDGETLRVGPLAVTAHLTPGHTPGSTAWTWQSCEGGLCLNMVYADSLTPVSAPGFRFTGTASAPGMIETFRRSIDVVDRLPCDVLVAVHPGFSAMAEKLRRRVTSPAPASDPFIDADACHAYAEDARRRLQRRIAEERSS
jgi:metallo-beta-lactamase class B